ncbi:cholecystokinin receptor-like [Lytechinus variegatus]|uniref:cholecystokinin receptor-like n=1 Tax=Lytechinus variegatus TaxID=7654 RepID=UPI001BB2182B|nr:cholecystokinin receptor-like [Lytechinus variegatus]
MSKSDKRSAGRLMLRLTLLSLVIVVTCNSSQQSTIQSPEVSQEASTVGWRFSSDNNENTDEISSQSLHSIDSTTASTSSYDSSDSLQTLIIQEFTDEFTTDDTTTSQPATDLVASVDTTIWVWQFSWTWVTILQLIISLIGILGNLLVVVVMAGRKSTANSTDIFIAALAISDLLTSIFNIPIPRARQVPDSLPGVLYCRLIFTRSLSWICVISSSYILIGASFERLAAVAYPLRIKEIFTNRRVCTFIIVAWVFSCLSCSYYLISMIAEPDLLSRIYCLPSNSDSSSLQLVNMFNFTIRLLIPVVLMLGSQIAMAFLLHLRSRKMQRVIAQGSNQSYHIIARNRVIKILLVVIIIYILCWAPSQIAFVVISFKGAVRARGYVVGTVRQILNLFTFINSSINPLIYAAQYPKFRSAVKDVFAGTVQKHITLFGIDNS